MKVYATYRPNDTIEGRGGSSMNKVFLESKHAKEYIDEQPGTQGIKGEKGGWWLQEIDVIEESIIDRAKKDAALRNSALSKLTDAEKKALGL